MLTFKTTKNDVGDYFVLNASASSNRTLDPKLFETRVKNYDEGVTFCVLKYRRPLAAPVAGYTCYENMGHDDAADDALWECIGIAETRGVSLLVYDPSPLVNPDPCAIMRESLELRRMGIKGRVFDATGLSRLEWLRDVLQYCAEIGLWTAVEPLPWEGVGLNGAQECDPNRPGWGLDNSIGTANRLIPTRNVLALITNVAPTPEQSIQYAKLWRGRACVPVMNWHGWKKAGITPADITG